MENDSRILVLGDTGMVGGAIVNELGAAGYIPLTVDDRARLPAGRPDLRDPQTVDEVFYELRPEYVFLAAAYVGGIQANIETPATMLRDNLLIATTVIEACRKHKVLKLLNLGSSCIYPRDAVQPMREDALLTGPLESTNEAYALAKIASLKLCDAYRTQYGCNFVSVMPCNLYGPGDRWDVKRSHVIPALIMRFIDAVRQEMPSVTVWGNGAPLREFLHERDVAAACVLVMEKWDGPGWINVGSGVEVSIRQLADLIAQLTGFQGEILWNDRQPNGTPRKVMDSSQMRALGWSPSVSLEDGLQEIIDAMQLAWSDDVPF